MNHLTIAGATTGAITMSSREIAELTGKEHKNVLADIRVMLEDLGQTSADFSADLPDAYGRMQPAYNLPKRECLILVAGYSTVLRARIIDRWQELEAKSAQPSFQLPTTFAGALRLAAEQAEQIEQQQAALASAAPKVAFVDGYVEATGLKGFREVAKLLKANEARFREFLIDRKIMYRINGEWVAYQPHIDAGRFEVKTGKSEQSGHAFNRSMFTPKGVEWIAGEWAKRGIQQALTGSKIEPLGGISEGVK